MSDDHVQDSEEFMEFRDEVEPPIKNLKPEKPQLRSEYLPSSTWKPVMDDPPQIPRRKTMMDRIAKSIEGGDLGWTGFLLLSPVVLAATTLILAVAYWMAFGDTLTCSRCGFNRSSCWSGQKWVAPAEDKK